MVDIFEHGKNMECGKYNESTQQKQGVQQRQWARVAKITNAKMKKSGGKKILQASSKSRTW
jgi:hypothetical protein